ncbi:MAG TPA: class I SAM-dependent methyltransferase [Candidatus Deferrimicrobiaceae bacterium]
MNPKPFLNETGHFYTGEAPSLLWEMTVCQSLADPAGPEARALAEPMPFGALLARWLARRIEIGPATSLLEVGGGYGTLMAAFLDVVPAGRVTMVDLSPRFSTLQREALRGRASVEVVTADVFDWLDRTEASFDLALSNENIGDFPAVDGLDAEALRGRARGGPPFGPDPGERAARLVHRYGLDLPEKGPIAVNVGALEYLEKLLPRVRAAFLSEHSCDAAVGPPWDDFLPWRGDHRPRRIELKDHAEYTIRFDHLAAVGRALGFACERTSMLELLDVRADAGARFMAAASCVGSPVAEAVHEFLHHVKEYECVLLKKESAR